MTFESGIIENPGGYGVTVARDGKFYVTGGTIDSKYSAIAGNNTDGDMNVYVSGNSILKAAEGPAIYKPSGGDLFIGNNAVDNTADSLAADATNNQPVLTGGVSVRMGDIKISGGTFTSFNAKEDAKNNCPVTGYDKQNAEFPDAFFTMGGTYKPATIKGEKPEEATNDLNIEIAGGNFTCDNDKGSAVTIPASIKISGRAYKVTAIANNAFKGNKKLAKVTIGANVKKIGKNAFNGCKNLKKVIIKTKKLTAKTIGKNAFKGINKKAVVKAPKNKVKSYNKIIKAKGAGKGVKVK